MEQGYGHTFIIAEIGSNHNQNINRAFELMETAKEAGADAVKFQSIKLEKLIAKEDIDEDDKKLFEQIRLEEEWYERIFEYARRLNIECISASTYLEAVDLLKDTGANYIKIASPQAYGFPELIKRVAQSGLFTIMSTGYCEDEEIKRAVELYKSCGDINKLTLLHCVSQYPTELGSVNLSYMKKLRDAYQVPVGYSDHTIGIVAPVMAVALGASIIEKHITISREEKGPDHFFALEPDEFKRMVTNIRDTEMMLGTGEKRLTDFEREYRETIVMHPYANRDIHVGDEIKREDITYYRSKIKGISPWDVEDKIVGKIARIDIPEGYKIYEQGADTYEGSNHRVYTPE